MITSKDFAGWKANPVTQHFMRYLKEQREDMKEKLASGTFTENSLEATGLKHADIIGRCTALQEVIDTTPEELGLTEENTKED